MRKCIYLFGSSRFWNITQANFQKYIGNDVDIFACTYDKTLPFEVKGFKQIILGIPDSQILNKISYELDCAFTECEKLKQQYEKDHNIVYTSILFSKFEVVYTSIIDWNNNYTIASVLDLNVPFTRIETYELISHTHAKINQTNKYYSIWNTNILSFLFENKINVIPVLNKEDIIFLIPSIIYTSPNKLFDNSTRSLFSPMERLEQTIMQLKSLKKINVKTFLLELSDLNLNDINQLIPYTDTIMFYNQDPKALLYANNDLNKSKGETYVMYKTCKMLKNKEFSHIFKFGGRYSLAETFDINDYLKDKPVFKIFSKEDIKSAKSIIEPVIYCIPYSHFEKFSTCLMNIMNVYEKNEYGSDIEHSMYDQLSNMEIYIINKLNVIGYGAANGLCNYL